MNEGGEPPAGTGFSAAVAALAAGLVLALREAIGALARRRGAPVVREDPARAASIAPKDALQFWELQQEGFRAVHELRREVHELREDAASTLREVRRLKAEVRRQRNAGGDAA